MGRKKEKKKKKENERKKLILKLNRPLYAPYKMANEREGIKNV